MRTPSLRSRVVAAGVCTTLGLLLGLDALLFVAVRSSQLDTLQRSLDAAELVVKAQADGLPPEELAAQVASLDVAVTVEMPSGIQYGPPVTGSALRRQVVLPSGSSVLLAAPRDEVDRALRRLLAYEALCTLLIVALAAVVLRWISEVALSPLGQVVAAARRTAGGSRGERLHPEQPSTELGEMAQAYDQMLDSLEASEEAACRLASIVESSDEAIIGITGEGRIFSWNRAAERIFGFAGADMVGQEVLDILPAEAATQMGDALSRARAGAPVRQMETVGLCRGGGTIDLAVTLSPVRDETGSVLGTSMIARDVTLEHRMADALQVTLANLEIALREARASEARTRQFLDDAAHQLRTPVTGIQACAETLLLAPRAPDRDRLLAALVSETSRLGRLISSLLTLARLDGDRIDIECGPCDIVALCGEEAERLRVVAPGLDVSLRADPLPHPSLADVSAVREVLGNLLDNARRHAVTTVEISVVAGTGRVEVRVKNDGPPLPEELVPKAFERFVSLDGAGGTGLGLPIARNLARACGGGLTYEDGAFVLRLPTASGRDVGPVEEQPAESLPA